MVSLDLSDPVKLIADLLTNNISQVPVAVIGADTRGGYTNPPPLFVPIEGDDAGGKRRKGRTDMVRDVGGAKATVYIYKASSVPAYTDLQEVYSDQEAVISIDINHIESRTRFHALYLEVRRIIMKFHGNPGGNWDTLKLDQDTELTQDNPRLWRITQDVLLTKVSEYVGHQ